jgi:hypothetical protein
MRSKTAVIAVALLAAAVGARLLAPPLVENVRRTNDAVCQFDDPSAPARLRASEASRWRDEAGWLATFAALAAAAAGAEVFARTSAHHPSPERTS